MLAVKFAYILRFCLFLLKKISAFVVLYWSVYTRMLRAILKKSWRQHPTKQQLYGHRPSITKTIKFRLTRHAEHCCRSREVIISDVLLWTPSYGRAKAGRPARTYIQQLSVDTGCSPKDLPEAMNDREGWREWARNIRADGTTRWLLISLTFRNFRIHSWGSRMKAFLQSIQDILRFFCLDWQFSTIILYMKSWSLHSRFFLTAISYKGNMSMYSMNLTIFSFRIDIIILYAMKRHVIAR